MNHMMEISALISFEAIFMAAEIGNIEICIDG